MKLSFIPSLLILMVGSFTGNCYAQQAGTDSTHHSPTASIDYFHQSIGEQSRLYNGAEYQPYSPTIKGNACFLDVNTWKPATVVYDSISYTNVSLQYDLYRDDIFALLYNGFSEYTLVKEKVQSFDLMGHHFINIKADSASTSAGIKPGYYDELYSGKITLLAKYVKTLQNTSSGMNNIETSFVPARYYYLKKGNGYYEVGSKAGFMNVLKDKRKELQQYLKANKIKFKDNKEQAMIKLAAYYDQINH